MDYLYSLCSLYRIASTLCFGFLAARHVGSQLPDQGLNPHTLVLEGEVLTAGPPGKSLMPVLRTIQDAMGIPMWLDPVQTGGWASSQPLFAAVVL